MVRRPSAINKYQTVLKFHFDSKLLNLDIIKKRRATNEKKLSSKCLRGATNISQTRPPILELRAESSDCGSSDAEKEIMRVEFASKVRPRLKYRPKAEKGAAKKGWTTRRNAEGAQKRILRTQHCRLRGGLEK